ncbi:MAG: dipeptidase PepE [Flavobacteriales bacterium]|nr:dipeptidase PepE [Flavobacteriales bacterium]
MRLLLLSNSTMPGEPFFTWPRQLVKDFLPAQRQRIAFVPFAAVSFSMDEYADTITKVFDELGHELISLHRESNPVAALDGAAAVAVGGGNSFQLLKLLYKHDLVRAIRHRVKDGLPYLGWSAGSNVACPTIMTTNDMPICEAPSLRAMNLVPWQINPHYTDQRIAGHGGESRDQRIAEYLELNRESVVAGLREGAALRIEGNGVSIHGTGMRVFRRTKMPVDVGGDRTLRLDLGDVDNA